MRYHFNLLTADGVLVDEEGIEIGDKDVRTEALNIARSLIGEDVKTGVIDLSGRIEVTDEYGRQLLVMPFTQAVELR